ncbi:MAG: FkbM family methyltransferase [Candidatus Colwellbacteria bacterium]|nr:FkbM family methyltransferase [Candidatus Colwellbacteria bacterium]
MPSHKIAFHLSHFSIRGSEIAVYDYAHYNEELLRNQSFIAVHAGFRDRKDYRGVSVHNEEIWKRFSSRFHIIEYTSKENLTTLLKEKDISIFYNLKSGENDGFVIDGVEGRRVKNVCHSIFTYTPSQKHGDVYIPISPAIVDKNVRDITPYVPHIVSPLPSTFDNIRQFLKISDEAIVFGRYGGEETFNIPFVHEAVIEIAEKNPNIYFVFVNTQLFTHPRNNIIFIEKLTNPVDKSIFINTCDAMLHGRKEGESFGLAIAEFSMAKKPIITWRHNRTFQKLRVGESNLVPTFQEIQRDFNMTIDVEHTHHIDVLGESGIYYSDKESLIQILQTFTKHQGEDRYTDTYSPQKVMSLFENYIINSSYSPSLETTIFDGQIYTHFSGDDLVKSFANDGWEPHVYSTIKSLLKQTDTFIDIGSNIGYHTIRIAPLISGGKVISIEPCKPIFDLLVHNVKLNNLKNVMCVSAGLSSGNKKMYIEDFSSDKTNFGDIRLLNSPLQNTREIQCSDLDYLLDGQKLSLGVIKIDVSGNEIDVIKGGIKTIMKYRPYIIIPLESKMFKSNSCSGLTYLMTVLDYSMIEIDSDYPCDHLCYPIEKKTLIEEMFKDRIVENKVNRVNDNRSLGIVTKIISEKLRVGESNLVPTFEKLSLNRPLRVKLMCNWTTGEELCKCWEKMSKGGGVWNNITVVSDDKDIDYYVIINKPLPGDKYIPSRTMVFRMEPDTSINSRWNDWYKSKREFMYFFDLEKYRNNSEWHLGLSYEKLQNDSIPKSKVISSVISSLYTMEGHQKRVDFVKFCQSKGMAIDVYGRDNLHNLKNHKGELPYHNKNDGILAYKYTFIAENCSLKNYFTEKIIDAILGECLCFYWGCPNIDSFIDPKAYILLDLNDMEKSYDIVCSAIKNDEWMKRLPYIMKEKEKIINHYSFFPRIEGYIQISNLDCKVVNLDRRNDRWTEFVKRAEEEDFIRYNRFSAVDGNILKSWNKVGESNPELLTIDSGVQNLFRNFSHRRPKRGEIGCCLSHLNIWKDVRRDTLVLEDDIRFCEGFNDRLSLVYRLLKESQPDFDILFIGYHVNKDVIRKNICDEFIESFTDIMKDGTREHPFGVHGGGTFGYILSPSGAKKLITGLSQNGFVYPVDYQMLLTMKTLNMKAFCCVSSLVESEMYEKNSVDTDIQKSDMI